MTIALLGAGWGVPGLCTHVLGSCCSCPSCPTGYWSIPDDSVGAEPQGRWTFLEQLSEALVYILPKLRIPVFAQIHGDGPGEKHLGTFLLVHCPREGLRSKGTRPALPPRLHGAGGPCGKSMLSQKFASWIL